MLSKDIAPHVGTPTQFAVDVHAGSKNSKSRTPSGRRGIILSVHPGIRGRRGERSHQSLYTVQYVTPNGEHEKGIHSQANVMARNILGLWSDYETQNAEHSAAEDAKRAGCSSHCAPRRMAGLSD